MAQWL